MSERIERQVRLSFGSGTTSLSEQELIEVSKASALHAELVISRKLIDFPEDVRGLTILDVGGGASDLTSRLVDLGADAYSVDPKYKSRSNIRHELKQAYLPKLWEDDKEGLDARIKAAERFFESIKKEPNRYRAASATAIPFPDNFFDMAYSVNAISVYLNLDRRFFTEAIEESLRVLKSGGSLQLFPFKENQGHFQSEVNQLRLSNDQFTEEFFSHDSRVADLSIETVGINRERLVIIKA